MATAPRFPGTWSGSPRRAVALVAVALAIGACGSAGTTPAAIPYGSPSPDATAPAASTASPAEDTGQAATGSVGARIAGFAFVPASISVPAGGSITWTNEDGTPHGVVADDGTFRSGTLAKGASFTWTFPEAGTWAYHCLVHPSMTGTVTVTP